MKLNKSRFLRKLLENNFKTPKELLENSPEIPKKLTREQLRNVQWELLENSKTSPVNYRKFRRELFDVLEPLSDRTT